MQTTTINIKGTHCNSCKLLIEDVCKDQRGAKSCLVDFASGKTVIEHDDSFDWKEFKKAVETLGNYKVEIN
jgi:copper chaperone CopZ